MRYFSGKFRRSATRRLSLWRVRRTNEAGAQMPNSSHVASLHEIHGAPLSDPESRLPILVVIRMIGPVTGASSLAAMEHLQTLKHWQAHRRFPKL